jgi:putative FmdB family regulatory protein
MFYDYVCSKCGAEKEVNHPMNEDPIITCECGEVMKRKITGGAGVHYKGSGWASNENNFRGDYSKVTKSTMKKRVEAIKE